MPGSPALDSGDRPALDAILVDGVVQLSFAVQEILGALAAEHDLSLTQVRLLGVLRGREPGMLELAGFLSLEKSSVTGLVDRAAARGLVERTRPSTDGRAVHVRLTADGLAAAERFAALVGERLAVLLAPLPSGDRAELARIAARVTGA